MSSGTIHSLPVPMQPWEDINVDLVTGLPVIDEFDGVCTIVDHFSKEIVVFPISSLITAEELAIEFRDKVWRCYRR